MLWSQFFSIFCEIIGVFLKNQFYDQIVHDLALFWVKNAIFSAKIL
jgi:hypothetical protein